MSEVDQAKHAVIHGNGYEILRALISEQEAAAVREYVMSKKDTGMVNSPGDTNVLGLLSQDKMFEDLATNPRLLAVAHELLGPDCKLAAFSAKILDPGCSTGGLHVDYPYWAMDPGMPVEPALMMQVIWMMEPFSEENGGTWIAPGSQLYNSHVDQERFDKEAIQATGNAGDAVISHGLLWHQTAINHSDKPRVALLINFSQLTIRPMREMGPFSDEFLEQASDELKELLPLNYGQSLRDRLRRNYSA